jgi:hypothetical protein
MNSTIAKTSTGGPVSPDLEKFLARVDPVLARLMFVIDATMSRQETWDRAAHLQSQMFSTVAALGGLSVQLVFYRGFNECVASRWVSDAKTLAATMSGVSCLGGHTQIRRTLLHAGKEHARNKIGALILISDACEEEPADLYSAARELGAPCFMFQEGKDEEVAKVYQEIARITKGAYCSFDEGSAQRLADLLKAVAAFAVGGVQALTDQNSEAARLLLTQVRSRP